MILQTLWKALTEKTIQLCDAQRNRKENKQGAVGEFKSKRYETNQSLFNFKYLFKSLRSANDNFNYTTNQNLYSTTIYCKYWSSWIDNLKQS